MNIANYRFLVSTALLISFIFVAVSGFVLMADLEKSVHELAKQIHIVFAIVFVILIIIHLAMNFRMYVVEAKSFLR